MLSRWEYCPQQVCFPGRNTELQEYDFQIGIYAFHGGIMHIGDMLSVYETHTWASKTSLREYDLIPGKMFMKKYDKIDKN